MTILAPRLAAALHDTLSFDFDRGSFTLLDRLFTWGDDLPSEDALRDFVRDTVHIRRSNASPLPETDAALLKELVSGITGTTTLVAPRAEPSGRIVILDGVRVRVPSTEEAQGVGDGVRIRVPRSRPRLTPGYAHVMSDDSTTSIVGATRVYLSAEEAPQLIARWHAALSALERKRIPFRAKVAASPRALPRADAIVLLSRDSRSVQAIIEAVKQDERETMRTSLFGLEIASGVAVGVEPPLTSCGDPVSFGESRSSPVASWLHRGIAAGRCPDIRDLVEEFTTCGIDPKRTWAPLDVPSWHYPDEPIEKENGEQ